MVVDGPGSCVLLCNRISPEYKERVGHQIDFIRYDTVKGASEPLHLLEDPEKRVIRRPAIEAKCVDGTVWVSVWTEKISLEHTVYDITKKDGGTVELANKELCVLKITPGNQIENIPFDVPKDGTVSHSTRILFAKNTQTLAFVSDIFSHKSHGSEPIREYMTGDSGKTWEIFGVPVDYNSGVSDFSPEVKEIFSVSQAGNRIVLTGNLRLDIVDEAAEIKREVLKNGTGRLGKSIPEEDIHETYVRHQEMDVDGFGLAIVAEEVDGKFKYYCKLSDDCGKTYGACFPIEEDQCYQKFCMVSEDLGKTWGAACPIGEEWIFLKKTGADDLLAHTTKERVFCVNNTFSGEDRGILVSELEKTDDIWIKRELFTSENARDVLIGGDEENVHIAFRKLDNDGQSTIVVRSFVAGKWEMKDREHRDWIIDLEDSPASENDKPDNF